MNQNAPIDDRTQARARPAPPPPPALSADARALLRVLMEGETALVRRRDMSELLRRLQALQSPAPSSESAVPQDRLDRLEGSLNRIDGALRIELAPILKAAVQDGLSTHRPPAQRRVGLWLALFFVAGCAVGVITGPAVRAAAVPLMESALPSVTNALPQIWGSHDSENQID